MGKVSNPFADAINLLVNVPPAYKLSGIVICLFFFLIWRASANAAIIGVLDRSLNVRLHQGQLFRIIRISLLLMFVFSLVLIILVFVSPTIQYWAETARIVGFFDVNMAAREKEAQLAKDDLTAGRYPDARLHYQNAMNLSPNETEAEYLRGMITATYYGQGLHREGLQYICDLYKTKASDDTRYVFAVQAHLRAIALKEGTSIAETVAQDFRTQCGRADYSEFWPSVPLGMMENLHDGALRSEYGYGLQDRDKARLKFWLQAKERSAAIGKVAFGDYAHYFLGDFDIVLHDFPKSKIRAPDLLDAGYMSRAPDGIKYLEQFVREFPKDKRAYFAFSEIISRYTSSGDRDDALKYLFVMHDLGIEPAVDAITSNMMTGIEKLINVADFKSADNLAKGTCAKLRTQKLSCNELSETDANLRPILNVIATESKAKCHRAFMLARKVKYYQGARTYLDSCLPQLQDDKLEYGYALYQLASVSRQIKEYDKSRDYLLRFVREIDDHPLLDDVYAELGWHYIVVEKNWTKAQEYLNIVITKYADRNAYDDALWWLAKGAAENGEYGRAIDLYGQIAALTIKSKFKQWGSGSANQLSIFESTAPLKDVIFDKRGGDEFSNLFVSSVPENGTAFQLGVRPHDELLSVCSTGVETLDNVLDAIEDATAAGGPCQISFIRKSWKLDITGSGSEVNGWNARLTQFNARSVSD
jgi:tetratricopeptide (TPR) repeat protein